MRWTKESAKKINDKSVQKRIMEELERPSPVNGSYPYWHRIVHNKEVDYRASPQLYEIGRGQQGVLSVEPYKSEIMPFWRFKTESDAVVSADSIYFLFKQYLDEKDFVGADMAKKFLHMGFTRARRYANHRAGVKYDKKGEVRPQEQDALTSEKALAAEVFKLYWINAKDDPKYLKLKAKHKKNCL
jgi:hypothetical protein